jgi:hypothetical protein
MDGTILSQGSFIVPATIVPQYIPIPSNVDWMNVYNFTQYGNIGTPAAATGIRFYWQRGMAPGTGIVEYGTNAVATVSVDTMNNGAFTLYDPSGQSQGALPLLGPAVATTATTNNTRPTVSTASTAGISVGTVIRMSNTAQTDVNGIDMVVSAVTLNTSFQLLTANNALATAPGAIGGAGFYRIVNYQELFYPRKRYVTNVIQGVNPEVTTSIAHGLTPGQEIRFNIPAVSGMTQLNPDPSNNYFPTSSSTPVIVQSVIDDYTITININTTGYTAFTWPTIAQQPSSFPELTPFGEDTATALSINAAQVPTIGGIQIFNTNTGILADSTVNTGFLGMILGTTGIGHALTTAISGPAGAVAGDVVYWTAGKSSYGGL